MRAPLPDRLDTVRLHLRAPQRGDAAHVFAAYAQDADVARHMIWRPHRQQAETEAFITDCIEAWRGDDRRPYVLTSRAAHDDAPIGMLEARVLGGTVDIGYVLARAHWGRGLMAEAITAFTGAVLPQSTVFRVQATCDVDNRGSARVLEKAGFVREGRLERWSLHPNVSDAPRACFMYARCR